MEIPTEKRGVKSINPNMMLIYGVPKSGKTVITSQLENHLILELEPNGADFVDARVMDIDKASTFNKVLGTIEKSEGLVADYLIIDTVSKLDEWSEIVGTYNFMDKPQGKTMNRIKVKRDGVTKIEAVGPTHPKFETVHELGQGYGYQHSRGVMLAWYDRLNMLIALGKVNHVILIAHVKDKLVETKSGDTVDSIDISLTGKVKSIYASRVDALAHFSRKGKEGILNFNNEFKVSSGGRCSHLDEEIIISKKLEDKTIETYWDRVFLKKK